MSRKKVARNKTKRRAKKPWGKLTDCEKYAIEHSRIVEYKPIDYMIMVTLLATIGVVWHLVARVATSTIGWWRAYLG